MLHLSAALQHFLFNAAFVQLCVEKKNLRDNKTTSLTFRFCDIKKAVECNWRAPQKRYLYANVKKIVHGGTMGGERRTS
jgi:hypothetical protein